LLSHINGIALKIFIVIFLVVCGKAVQSKASLSLTEKTMTPPLNVPQKLFSYKKENKNKKKRVALLLKFIPLGENE
jgi:hypothetical protein